MPSYAGDIDTLAGFEDGIFFDALESDYADLSAWRTTPNAIGTTTSQAQINAQWSTVQEAETYPVSIPESWQFSIMEDLVTLFGVFTAQIVVSLSSAARKVAIASSIAAIGFSASAVAMPVKKSSCGGSISVSSAATARVIAKASSAGSVSVSCSTTAKKVARASCNAQLAFVATANATRVVKSQFQSSIGMVSSSRAFAVKKSAFGANFGFSSSSRAWSLGGMIPQSHRPNW
jgi:hypothetical protein